MSSFVPSREELNPKWFETWGETFGATELAKTLSQNDRLFDRVRDRMFESCGMDTNAQLDEQDVEVANSFAKSNDRFSRICGLVIHGKFLRTKIAKADFDVISRSVPFEDLKIAMTLSGYHANENDFDVDLSKLSSLVEGTGKACLATWKSTLSDQMAKRVQLMTNDEDLSGEVTQEIDSEYARAVVAAVGNALSQEDNSAA